MTFYPTTLLPSSPPYDDYNIMVTNMVDRCIAIHDHLDTSEIDRLQIFDLTMSILAFWEEEGFLGGIQ